MSNWKNISAAEVKRRMEAGEHLHLIDVREDEEFASGRIPGSRLVPLSRLPLVWREMDPDQEMILICRSGNRSRQACEYLSLKGFTRLYNMEGGLLEWTGDLER